MPLSRSAGAVVEPRNELHVAPWGRDAWPGTAEQPFATLHRAQQSVRAATATMSSDLIVNLRAGTYQLTEPFQLLATEGDSGENGHRVVYQAYGYGSDAQEEVIISGGREVSEWLPHDSGRNIWRAEVGALDTRQLFVEGRRALRAAVPASILGALGRTQTGYVTESPAPLCWHSPADIGSCIRASIHGPRRGAASPALPVKGPPPSSRWISPRSAGRASSTAAPIARPRPAKSLRGAPSTASTRRHPSRTASAS